MADIPEPAIRPVCFEVSCVPRDNINARSFTLTVRQHQDGLWSVGDGYLGLDAEGRRHIDPNGTAYRHDLDTALRLASEAAPRMTTFNGYTVADALRDQEVRHGE